jgi:O-acetylhomoserine/O-acetylserine sulfhydrylase-like pyridoxal-dependent enzyme
MATIINNLIKTNRAKALSTTSRESGLTDRSMIEDRLGGLINASVVLSTKSVKSAVYLLVKKLLKRGQNIVTVNSVSLLKNEIIRERLGIEVRLTEDENLLGLRELIDEQTGLIFLESVGLHNHIIPDFQKIITLAHSKNIPVAVYNTIGLAGSIFNPLKWGADFSIEDFSKWSSVFDKAIIAERKETSYPILSKLKDSDSNQDTPLILPENLIAKAKEFEAVPLKFKRTSSAAATTAKWLKEITHVKAVEFVGNPNHKSHFNALKYFSSGYGNVISFSLWTNYRSFDFFLDNLIPRSLQLFQLNDINYENKKVTITVLEAEEEKIVTHFQYAFELLQKHLGSDYFLYENLYDVQDVVGY